MPDLLPHAPFPAAQCGAGSEVTVWSDADNMYTPISSNIDAADLVYAGVGATMGEGCRVSRWRAKSEGLGVCACAM